MTTIKTALVCELGTTDWRETLMKRIRARGFASATVYADTQPQKSLKDLAAELGLPSAAGYGLERELIEEAEQSGGMDHCARGLLVRDLWAELPDGWPAADDSSPARVIQRAEAFASLAFALPQAYQPALHRVRNAMESADIPGGWLPLGPEDLLLMEVFVTHWDPLHGPAQPV